MASPSEFTVYYTIRGFIMPFSESEAEIEPLLEAVSSP